MIEQEQLPAGTVTFLLTDIEGSTRAWEDHGPEMAKAVARHYDLLDDAVRGWGGVRPTEQGEGDSLVAAFPRASDAVSAALYAQRTLLEEDWPAGAELVVRMALHTGEAQIRDGQYYIGPSIIRCARLRALAHGGQVLISNTTADLLTDGLPEGASLRPLGVHRLKDLRQAERVFQLAHPALPDTFPPLRSLDALPNNLPTQLTSFIGRDRELSAIARAVKEHRLVTLVGAGGCGKTRLALQLGGELVDDYPDGVWWVDLATLMEPESVAPAVMAAIGVRDTRNLEPLDRITRYLAEHHALLILDNCEHVLAAAARLADRALRTCPELKVLATSREPMGVAGETAWKVPPLTLVEDPASARPEELLTAESVRLFVERATAARPSFTLDADDAPTVAALCARLDGIPLAIELAAARVRSLAPDRILAALSDRFRLLTGGARTALPRQQTLQASVEWSHDLLGETERVLLRRLAVFSGGFTLDAAEAVTAGAPLEDWEIVTVLSSLVDRSLVVFEGDRYRLLQTIADFARTRLVEAGEAEPLRDRHARWFLGWAETVSADLERNPSPAVLASLEADHENLRSALGWLLERPDHDGALRLASALGFFWTTHGHYSEGRTWLRRALDGAPASPTVVRGRALQAFGHIALWGMASNWGYGMAETEEALALAQQFDDPSLAARTLADQLIIQNFITPEQATATFELASAAARRADDDHALRMALWEMAFGWATAQGRWDRSVALLEELAESLGPEPAPFWQGWCDQTAGVVAWHQGRLADARELLERAVAVADELGEPKLEVWSAVWLANVQLAQGDYDAARSIVRFVGERQKRSVDCAEEWIGGRLARAALAQGDTAEARRQFAQYSAQYLAYQIPFFNGEHAVIRGGIALAEGDLATARTAFSEAMAIAVELSNPWALVEAHNLEGRLASAEGAPGRAEDAHHRALALCRQHSFAGVAADTLEALASLAAAGDSHAEAARLFGAASVLRERTGQARWPVEQADYDGDLAGLRAALGNDAFDTAWKEGADLSLDEVCAYASRARGERKRPSRGWESLTPTELDVVALAATGLSNAEIGARLFMSPTTAKTHLAHIYAKLGVANRAALAAKAAARGATSESCRR